MCKLEDFRSLIYDFILIYHKKYRYYSVWYVLSPYTFGSLARPTADGWPLMWVHHPL